MFVLYLTIFWKLLGFKLDRKIKRGHVCCGILGGFLVLILSGLIDVPFLILGQQQLTVRVLVPIWEEVFKAIVIWALIKDKLGIEVKIKNGSIVFLGANLGLSFALYENLGYILSYNTPLQVVVGRGFSTWLMHIVGATISSYGIQKSLSTRRKTKILPYVVLAILIHFLMNNGDLILQSFGF